METCGFYDFGWKDLICPTPKRFRDQLSAAINMFKFREDQLKIYAELNEPVRCRAYLRRVLDFQNFKTISLTIPFITIPYLPTISERKC